MNAIVLVILALSAKAPHDQITFGYFETAKECWTMATQIDRSTLLILELSCKALA